MSTSPFAIAYSVLALCSLPAAVGAQCTTGFVPGGWPGPSLSARVTAVAALANGDVLVALEPSTLRADVERWDGTGWTHLGTADRRIEALVELPNGDLLVAGGFTAIGPNYATMAPAVALARWDGVAWSEFAGGANGVVDCLALAPNGDVVVGGQFTQVGGVPANRIAIWSGSSWSALGSGLPYAGSPFEGAQAVAVLPNGDIVAGGNFRTAGGVAVNRIARWDGVAWSPLGAGFNSTVLALAVLANGDLAAGTVPDVLTPGSTGVVALWDGIGWTSIATVLDGGVRTLVELPGGDLLAGGTFWPTSGLGGATHIARWGANGWSGFGTGTSNSVDAMAVLRDGRVVIGGMFVQPAAYAAQLETSCPAVASVAGVGCVGSAGFNQLATVALPWSGSTFRARATGLTNDALALAVFGLAPASVPLSSLLPQGVPGCGLHATTDSVRLALPVAGAVETSLSIPSAAGLVGVVLHHQVLAAELDPQGAIVAVTSTNSLVLTIGAH